MSKLHTLHANSRPRTGDNAIFRFFSHPIVLLVSWSLILINGEHTGGPFIFYLFFGFPKSHAYALLGYGGIIVLLLSVLLLANKGDREPYYMLNLFGGIVTFLSITTFFYYR